MNELALFAGAGGGILANELCGDRTVCAVERDAYAAAVLAQRQNDGTLPVFPIWSDVCTFDGRPSSVTLPQWGLMLDGVVYQLKTSALPMNGIAPGWSGETLPTPSVAMAKGSSENALTRVNGKSRLRNRLDYWVERDGKAGRLNPEFIEWVMGWPIGGTDVAPLATDKYHEWQQQHGKY